ncbi:aspartyl/glutamyl-tRNA amidotransferase subunit A [Williamsoniiplasma somnilux]|uniref:Aspartyl/glutamyl-tRNA amidotransferase subunit A n=1 Tax=Williamsoniiplasma somnilux TaxID=215578 RepID=A0A2K8NYU9_9MOLU|nr:amidase family protein [Williamsoniiplasma somnilux]ATZ18995.1 aspartyl/glutamyl-tRNA amidotransferase subunit A [Williamsoniiplasma somnilux]
MNIRNMSIVELHEALKNKKITVTEIAQQVIEFSKKDLDSNFMITLPEKEIMKQAEELNKNFDDNNFLYGIPYMAKDNFATKGIRTTASTKILDNFVPTYDATLIEKLNKNKTLMSGKVALDELGLGGTGLHSAYGELVNPRDSKRLLGGSSSGSVYAVTKGYVPFATGTDTGDSIRKPASFNGIVGFKPTYGALSRYGIFPYAPSLDHAGFFTRNVDDMAIVFEKTVGFDPKDFTSIKINDEIFYAKINDLSATTTFAYIKEVQENLPEPLKTHYESFYNKLSAQGYQVSEINFRRDLLDVLAPVYMMISFPEAVSTISNLDGINFGLREPGDDFTEIMTKTRSKYLGDVVKRRFVIGSLNLKKENQELYMNKAKKVRRLIVEEISKIYKNFDVLIIPSAIGIAPLIEVATEFEDDSKQFLEDILTLANFSGMPSITIPFVEEQSMPIGINLNTAPGQDLKVLQAAKVCENIIGIKNKVVN